LQNCQEERSHLRYKQEKSQVQTETGIILTIFARIVGVDLPRHKRGEIGLTYIYGVGRSTAQKVLDEAGVDRNAKVEEWTDEQINAIRRILNDNYKLEGELRSETQMNIKRLMDIGCYRGVRHRIGLPVRGQSTKNNARTRKGRKKTVANKKKATK
jgi:small subunit ribosomal protein S13